MITIYNRDETDFTHRGLGTLPDATEAEVQEEINGIYDLRITYPKNGRRVDLIEEERIVKSSTPKGDQLFRISKVRKDLNHIEINAFHIFYDLSGNFIEDTFIQNKGGQAALQQVLDRSVIPHNFTAISDVSGPMNVRIVRYNTVHAIMGEDDNTLIARGGGELERDNHVIRWKQRLGEDRGVKIKYRKNLLGIDFEIDYSTVVTQIMPQGFDGFFLPEKYVDSPRINDYFAVKIQKREYDVVSAEKSPEQEGALPHHEALAKLRSLAAEDFAKGIDLPQLTCFVDFVDLAQTEEYKEYQVLERIYIGDTVRIIYPEQKIEVSARMTMYKWDALKHRYNNLLIGTPQNELRQSLSSGEKALVKTEEMQKGVLEKAREAATNLINAGFGGHVRIYPDRILIMDTEDEATAVKVWQWNMGGLGHSKTGINGPHNTAMTSDGAINGEMLAVYSITANKLAADVGQSLDLSSNTSINLKVSSEVTNKLSDPAIQEKFKGKDGEPGKDVDPVLVERLESQINQTANSISHMVEKSQYDANNNLLNQWKSEIEQRANALEVAVQDGGGLNHLLNSVGYAGFNFWEKTGTIEAKSTTWILGESTSKYGFLFGSGSLVQEISLKAGRIYTLSLLVNNVIGSNFKVSLGQKQADETVTYEEIYSTSENYVGKIVHEFEATSKMVLKIENSGSAEAEVTDIMLAEGKNQTVWTQANGEMYTVNVLIDRNGIAVKHTDGSKTVMSPQEFAGYYNDQRIFSLNGYLTEVMGILIKKEGLHIPPIKMVQREGVSLDIVWTGG